jgi:hypothetical protein
MTREKRVKALYTLIKLSNRAKNIEDYKLSNLTFGLATIYLENFEIKYENADNPLSVYYDVVTVCLADRSLSIPAPLLSKDALAECLKRSTIIELPEHNRQFRQFESLDERKKSFDIIASRYLRIINKYFDVGVISTALSSLDVSEEFEQWCFNFLSSEANDDDEQKTQEQGLRPHRIIEKKCSIS